MFHEGKDLAELFGKLGAPKGFPTSFSGFAGSGRSLKGKSSSAPSRTTKPSVASGGGISADEKAFNKAFAHIKPGAGTLVGSIIKGIGFKRLKQLIAAGKR